MPNLTATEVLLADRLTTSPWSTSANDVMRDEARRNEMMRTIMEAMDVMTAQDIPEQPRYIHMSSFGMQLLRDASIGRIDRFRVYDSDAQDALSCWTRQAWARLGQWASWKTDLTYNSDGQAVLFPELESNERPNRIHNLRRPEPAGRNADRGDRDHRAEQEHQDRRARADLHPAQGQASQRRSA